METIICSNCKKKVRYKPTRCKECIDRVRCECGHVEVVL